jgi:hypothetical protein
MKSMEHRKNLKTGRVPYDHAFPQKPNPSRETVPLMLINESIDNHHPGYFNDL